MIYTLEQKTKRNNYARIWRLNNPNKVSAIARSFRIRHLDKVKEWKKLYRTTHMEQIKKHRKQYYQNNKERIRQHTKDYVKNNREEVNKKQEVRRKAHPEVYKKYRETHKQYYQEKWRKYYLENRDLLILRAKKWADDNPYKRKALYHNRRLRTRDLTLEVVQLVYENNIIENGRLTCIYCSKPIPFGKDTLEHKHPLALGGSNKYENLAIACKKCNCRKNKKTEKDFREQLLREQLEVSNA